MTVYLNRELFKPAMIVLSAAFGALILLFLILTIAFFNVVLLVILLALAAVYGVSFYLVWLVSKSNKYYMEEKRGFLDIRYPTINYGRGHLQVPYKALVEFQYYPLQSKNSWINFITYGAVPGCTYLSYHTPQGKVVTELLGYITKSDAEALAQRYGVGCTIK